MAKKRFAKKDLPIIAGYLEKIGQKVFTDYSSVITKIIKGNQGIYALYKKDKLYYVGLASNLKTRIKQHLNDKHKNCWTHFSLFIINKQEHIKEIESLILHIAYPKGNSIKGKFKAINLRKKLKQNLKDEWLKRLDDIIGGKKNINNVSEKKKRKKNKTDKKLPLYGLLRKYQRIYANYKGKDYKAKVLPNGTIELMPSKQRFDSPSMAGIKIIKKKTINGWKFWKYKNKEGKLVYIDELRKTKPIS